MRFCRVFRTKGEARNRLRSKKGLRDGWWTLSYQVITQTKLIWYIYHIFFISRPDFGPNAAVCHYTREKS